MNTFTFIKKKHLLKKKKGWLGMLVMPLLFACLAGAKPQEKTTDALTWTSLTGHQIVAEFVELKGETLILKDQDGVERSVRLPMLTSIDQALAKQLEEQRVQGDAQTNGSSSNRLPIFISGPAKGNHAIYSHKNFTAKVNASGVVEIQCLEDEKAVGKPLRLYFSYDYYKYPKLYARPVTVFQKFSTPTLSPTRLEYEATLKDGATTGINYAFVDNTIQAWGWVIDPPNLKEPTSLHLAVRFLPSHTFSPETLVSEQKKILKPYTLAVYEKKKGLTRFPYGETVRRLPWSARKMTVEGPIFGKRCVSVSAQSQQNTALDIINYQNYAPYQGYTVRLKKDKQSSKSDSERMIITID